MKCLDREDIITCENNSEYVVADSILLDDNNFVYLVKKDNPEIQTIALVTEENERIRIDEIDTSSENNKEIIKQILAEMAVDIYTSVSEEINNED